MSPELLGTLFMLCYRDLLFGQRLVEKSRQMYAPEYILNLQSSLSCNAYVNFTMLFAFGFI